jgi:hypothetical protein
MRLRAKKKVDSIVVAFIVLMLSASALTKIFHTASVTERLSRLGVGRFMTILGIVELLMAVLFIYSRTMKLSFILLSCYFSGAIATEISHNGNFIGPFLFLVLIWIASFIRERSILKLAENDSRDKNPWNVNWMMVE